MQQEPPLTQQSYALFLAGPRVSPEVVRVPRGAVAVWCTMADEVIDKASRLRPRCIVLDGDAVPDAAAFVRKIRRAAGVQPVIARVGDAAVSADVDHTIEPGTDMPGEVARLVRFAVGQTLRSATRVRCATRAVVELRDDHSLELHVADLSEYGVRVTPATGLSLDNAVRLRVSLDEGREVCAFAQPVRLVKDGSSGEDSIAYRFLDIDIRGRAHLRAFLIRCAGVRLDATAEHAVQRAPGPARSGTRAIVGRSTALQRMLQTIERAAPTDVTVLLLGETGTGKELAARALHEGSSRAGRPFVAVNCAALPENLVESELFGHEAGAFTGATKRKIGRIEQAAGGTLFLDEIGDLPAQAQAKLLRALQERTIERVGGSEQLRVDFRLIAATNQDLESGVAQKSFRRDLFFRLNVVAIHLPPLRDRPEDIPLLANHFLHRAQEQMGKRDIRLNEHAAANLLRYPWPGNVRELENVCSRLVALAQSGAALGPEHLGLFIMDELVDSPLPSTDLRDILDFCEREIVKRMLDRHGGNRTRTAESLGISRQALQQKLARFRGVSNGDAA
jgi:DNA-binding NtrC family response regulator